MSYLFDGANDSLAGTFSSTYADPVTLACWLKVTAHPVANDAMLMFGNSSSVIDHSYVLKTSTSDDVWQAVARDTTNSGAVSPVTNVDGIWAAMVGVFTNNDLRDVYILHPGLTARDTVNKAPNDVLQFIRVGEDLSGLQDYADRLAEISIWNAALTTKDITRYMVGVSAAIIAPANLIGYWPLNANNATQQNLGIDAGGDLTVTGAVFDADHPLIYGYDTINIPGRRVSIMP